MEKITFVNGQAPFLNEQNLNQLQTNVENAIEAAKNKVNENIPTKITDLENDSTFLAKNDDFNTITGRVHITNSFDDYQERKIDLSLGYLVGAESGGSVGTLHINEKCDTDVHVLKDGTGTLFYKDKEVATQEYVDEQISNIETSGGGISEIPIASTTTLGGIKVGANLTIDEDGTLNASASGGSGSGSDYELPIASAETLGGIKVGDNLSIDENGVLSASGSGSDYEDKYRLNEEVKTNKTWINGKPIYRQVLKGTKVAGTNLTWDLSSFNIDYIMHFDGSLQLNSVDGYQYPLNRYESNSTFTFAYYAPTTKTLSYNGGSSWCSGPVTIIIEYTKTTDEATITI